jgi:hypothetical protein
MSEGGGLNLSLFGNGDQTSRLYVCVCVCVCVCVDVCVFVGTLTGHDSLILHLDPDRAYNKLQLNTLSAVLSLQPFPPSNQDHDPQSSIAASNKN